jgi:hypothetical protein
MSMPTENVVFISFVVKFSKQKARGFGLREWRNIHLGVVADHSTVT